VRREEGHVPLSWRQAREKAHQMIKKEYERSITALQGALKTAASAAARKNAAAAAFPPSRKVTRRADSAIVVRRLTSTRRRCRSIPRTTLRSRPRTISAIWMRSSRSWCGRSSALPAASARDRGGGVRRREFTSILPSTPRLSTWASA
jgi:hypothetical protein